jgi:hypothetical protein
MRYVLSFVILCISGFVSLAQTDNMGVGTLTPDPSAKLEVSSTSKGFLAPRMSSVERLAILNPAQGLLVFDLTSNSFWYYNSGTWTEFITQIPAAPSAILFSSFSQTGIAGSAEAIMGSYVIPANTLDANGQAILVHAFGLLTTDTALVRLKFSGIELPFQTYGQGFWELTCRVYRTSANTSKCAGTLVVNGSSSTFVSQPALDFSAAIPFQITGQQVQPVVNGVSMEGFEITRIR